MHQVGNQYIVTSICICKCSNKMPTLKLQHFSCSGTRIRNHCAGTQLRFSKLCIILLSLLVKFVWFWCHLTNETKVNLKQRELPFRFVGYEPIMKETHSVSLFPPSVLDMRCVSLSILRCFSPSPFPQIGLN